MTRHDLACLSLALGAAVILGLGLAQGIKAANVKVEARCSAQGGQVIVTPWQVSRCLLPAAR
jgi:hypothetical protein